MANIVVLHGWGKNAPARMESLTLGLRAKGHDVFRPDLPGFGKQEPPKTPWFVSDYVVWVLEQVKEQKNWDTFVLCGHSFGGRIALKMSAEYGTRVEQLILVAAAGLRQKLSIRANILRHLSNIGKAIFNIPIISRLQPVVHTMWRKLLRRKDYYQASGVMQETFLNVIHEDLSMILPAIQSDTLILWGKKDQFVSVEDAHTMHGAIPHSVLKIYSQADHFLPYEAPEELAEDIDEFLKVEKE